MVAEENDPTALAQQSSPADAIEPISQGRLDLFKGVTTTGTSGGIGLLPRSELRLPVWYRSLRNGQRERRHLDHQLGDPAGDSHLHRHPRGHWRSGLFNPTRPLYLYVRNGDIASTTPFQSPGTENWLNTLFYDPCDCGAGGCS